MAKTLTLTNEQHKVLMSLLRQAVETAPEDLAAMLSEALPDRGIGTMHRIWMETIEAVSLAENVDDYGRET